MIQSAVSSVSSSLSLVAGIPAAAGEDAAAPGAFAALLDSTTTTGQDGLTDPAATLQAALGLQVRQGTGNTAGKKLPGELADTAAALADAAAKIGDGTGEGEDATTELAPTPALPTTDIVLPGLIVPMPIVLPQSPEPVATAAASTGSGTGQAIRTAPTTSQPAIATALALQTQATASATVAPATTAQTATQATATPVDQGKAPVTVAPDATMLQANPGQANPAHGEAVQQPATAPAVPSPVTISTAAALASQANGQAKGQTTAPDGTPKAADNIRPDSKLAGSVTLSGNQPSTLSTLTASQQATTAQAAAKPETTVEPAKADAAPTITAKAATPELKGDLALSGEAKKTDAGTVAADLPAQTAATTAADPAQPMLAAHDGQTLSQTVGGVHTAPATSAVQSGHDFATLVDRLVEAREAASPGTVQATLSHAEFGQVSLRIDQDKDGLAVTMSSADPDFAGAVQASAASAQAQTSSDDRSNQQRQDTQSQLQQQGASLTSGNSQAQSQSFGQGGREERGNSFQNDTRGSFANEKSTIIDDSAETRGGIYA